MNRRYSIILREELDPELDAWFEGLKMSSDEQGHGILSGEFSDQAELVSLLAHLHQLNFTVLALAREDYAARADCSPPARV